MSIKLQISLPDDLAQQLKRESARRKISVAEFIRLTRDARLLGERRAKGADPFAGITGLVDAAETDLAARVDEVLYR